MRKIYQLAPPRFFAFQIFLLFIITSVSMQTYASIIPSNDIESDESKKQELFSYLENMPIAFRKNVGQWDTKIYYKGYTKGWDASIAFLKNEVSYRFLREKGEESNSVSGKNVSEALQSLVWNVHFKNSNPTAIIDGGNGTPSIYNYIRKSGTYLNVPDHSFVKYKNIYSNIDIAYYIEGDKLKHDYAIHPNGNINDIALECKGVNSLSLNRLGELEINTVWGTLIEKMPESYQIIEGKKVNIEINYTIIDDHTYGFKVIGNYSKNHTIIIDPIVMDWCTYLTTKTKAIQGGNNYAQGIDVDDAGFAYVTGFINEDFDPTPGAYDGTQPGPTPSTTLGNDVFVVKMNLAGSAFVYATYIGGTDGADRGHDIRVKNGLAHVTGMSESSDFPTTTGCYDASWNGNGDAFAIKLNATGTALVYSTLFGGNQVDNPYGIDVDGGGNMYITGNTWSNNLPTKSAYDATFNAGFCDAFAAKINPAGTGANDLIYSTYIGGNSYDRGTECAVNAAGELHLTGTTNSTNFPTQAAAFGAFGGGNHDAFVTKLNAAGSGLIFSTYLGGSGDEYILPVNGFNGSSYGAEYGGIAVASTGDVFVVGTSGSANFPVTAGAYSTTLTGTMDVFVAKLTSTGALTNATFIGAPGYENRGYGVDLNSNNEPFVSGFTFNGFPTTACSFDPSFNSAAAYQSDFFLAKFSNNLGTLIYSTFIGGSEFEYNSPKIALIDKECYEDVYMCGTVHSKNGFPTTATAYQPVHQYNNGADEPAAWKFKPEIDVDFTNSAILECNTPINFFGTATGNCIWQNGAWTASAWEWTFGDGGTASTQNPTHTYTSPGTYTVTLKVKCPTDSVTKVIVVLPNATCACNVSVSATSTNATCGLANGSATTTTTGTNGTVSYSWSTTPSQTTSTATGLNTGTYTVQITDGDGCTATTTVNITNTVPPTGTTTPTNVTCFGGTNGSAIANPTGTSPFTYSWSAAAQTTQTATGLANGTYSVTITDAIGCTVTVPVTITQPTAVGASTTPSPVLCFGGNTGSASVSANGGTPGYTYSWSTTPSQSTVNATGLSATTFSVLVTDANGCTATTTAIITQPTDITIATSTTNPNCGASDGDATATPSGGTPGYSYSWNTTPSQSVATAINLAAGFYTVTVTDMNGCTKNTTVTLTGNNTPALTETHTNVTCFGGNDGTATITATLGTPGYNYTWSGGIAGNTNVATNLTAGTHTVIVSDQMGCANNITVTITEPTEITFNTNTVDVKCFGGNDGSATVSSANGTGTHTYSWSTTPSQSTTTATGLSAGTYSVLITDENGCTKTTTVNIIEPPLLTVSANNTPPLCNLGTDGTLSSIAGGGTPTYTYSWTGTACATANCNNVAAGTYTITITDANGCTATNTTIVNEPTPIALNTSANDAHCMQPDGDATVTANGGTPNYTYSWLITPTQSTATATGLVPNTYSVVVTDANGCSAQTTVVVGNITGVVISIINTTNVTCNGLCDGTATADATGLLPPFSYNWNTNPSQTSVTATGLCAGTYTVTVTDNSGCQDFTTVTITEPTPVTLSVNPDQLICIGQSATLTATASGGTPAYTISWNPGTTGVNQTVSPTSNTTYTATVTDANGCTAAPATTTVNLNPPLSIVATGATTYCAGSGGSANLSATASGGNGNYTYSWSAPINAFGASQTVNPQITGSYTYTVTVNDDCGTPPVSTTVTVIVAPAPTVIFTGADTTGCVPVCVKFTNNTLNSNTCSWTFGDGSTSTECTPNYCYKTVGVYSVSLTVTDNNGCSATSTHPNMVHVWPYPHADFNSDPEPASVLEPTVYFQNNSTPGNGASFSTTNPWYWDFGDGSSSTEQGPSHYYNTENGGTFDVTLTVENNYGCRDSITKPVTIKPDWTFYVPNTFTPNGDNHNDYFVGKGTGINSYEMWIYDRWGNEIYHCTDINKPWDGRVQNGASGEIAQIDTYVWLILISDVFDKKHRYIGHVNIVK